ncbi:MAG: cytochrome c [Bacteroidetes bacterium]|nr:cytochrome c [Bacteroidota bacterium]
MKATHIHLIWGTLLISWIVYLGVLLAEPVKSESLLNQTEQQGKQLWQKHNCQSCHQLFGLGGYLGPDLTSIQNKIPNRDVFQILVKTGNQTMPAYNLNPQEVDALYQFLLAQNRPGPITPLNHKADLNGWISKK